MVLVIGNAPRDIVELRLPGEIIMFPEVGKTAPEQVEWASELEEYGNWVVVTTSQTIINALDYGHYERTWVWKDGELKPLKDVVDPAWASHFSLGDLYAGGRL